MHNLFVVCLCKVFYISQKRIAPSAASFSLKVPILSGRVCNMQNLLPNKPAIHEKVIITTLQK